MTSKIIQNTQNTKSTDLLIFLCKIEHFQKRNLSKNVNCQKSGWKMICNYYNNIYQIEANSEKNKDNHWKKCL